MLKKKVFPSPVAEVSTHHRSKLYTDQQNSEKRKHMKDGLKDIVQVVQYLRLKLYCRWIRRQQKGQ